MIRPDARRGAVSIAATLLLTTATVATASPVGAAGSSAPTALSGVACPDSTNCVAVGTRVIASLNKTLVKRWNGARWSVIDSPNPPGPTNALLNGVACQSATNCIAVGEYSAGSRTRTLIEQWNGTTWSIIASPNPPGKTLATLSGVACLSATSCIAVGTYSTKTWSRTLVEQWNGTTWSIGSSPNPHGLTFATLDGVSCPTGTSCYAVGAYSTKTWSRTLVEHWNGTTWSIVASPNPSGRNFAIVGSVSCPSDASCFAVGFYMTDATTKTLVEHWNGVRWSIVGSPNPAPGLLEFAGLGGVTCLGTTNCYSVGFAVTGVGSRPLIEHWNGTRWSIDNRPDQPGTLDFPALLGVACASSTRCYAVGFSKDKTLIEHGDGQKWSIDT